MHAVTARAAPPPTGLPGAPATGASTRVGAVQAGHHPHAEGGTISECTGTERGRSCRSHRPGHRLPSLHVKLLRRSPWGWRAGTVTAVDGDGWLTVEVPAEAGVVRGWHHHDLRDDVRPGDEVQVHERHSALAGRFGALSLLVASGIGPVPDPVPLEVWGDPAGATVIDLRTGTPVSGPARDLARLS